MNAFRDGSAVCITLDDFENLQESPAVFADGEVADLIAAADFDLNRVAMTDPDVIENLLAQLLMPANAVRCLPAGLPEYKVFFIVHSDYLLRVSPILERHEQLNPKAVACWTVASSNVDFSDFARKGSVAVDGCFIHDDYRVGGDCIVYKVSG